MKEPHQDFIDEKMLEISKVGKVVDIGGGERFQKWLAKYKDLFCNAHYMTMDNDPNSGADIIGDIHAIPLADASVDAIICHSVLEHVKDPVRAVGELKRVLAEGGKIFVHVPSIYPYHARKGHYADYWRFFDDTLLFLFKDFAKVEIKKRGGYFKALFFFIPFQHKMRPFLDIISNFLDKFFKTETRTTTSGYYVFAVK